VNEPNHGFDVVFLLGGTFRRVIDDLHRDLAARGHAGVRPMHGFALQAIGPGGATISELGRRLGVSKQAAAKTVRSLETAGYVSRRPGIDDGRSVLIRRTDRGQEVLALSARFFETRMQEWRSEVGLERFDAMIEALAILGAGSNLGDFPGWLGQ
jgi:DNA-binding MarR family transcriptional regulator